MEGIVFQTPNVFPCIAAVVFVKEEKKVILAQKILIAMLICTVNRSMLIHIFQPAKNCFLHMKLALIHFNVNILFSAGILLQKKLQTIISQDLQFYKRQHNSVYLYILKTKKKHLDGVWLMDLKISLHLQILNEWLVLCIRTCY